MSFRCRKTDISIEIFEIFIGITKIKLLKRIVVFLFGDFSRKLSSISSQYWDSCVSARTPDSASSSLKIHKKSLSIQKKIIKQALPGSSRS